MLRRFAAIGLVIGLVASCSTGGSSSAPSATSAPATTAASVAPATAGTSATAAASAASADWCSKYQFKTVKPGVLTVATYGTGEPDMIVNADKTLGGIEGSLFKDFTKACNLKLELFETTFASMILAVKNGDADVGTYIFWNEDRSKQVYYTMAHWIADTTHVFTRADFPYTDASSCDGKKVGTVVGFVWAPYLQKKYGANAVLFPDDTTGTTAMLQGQVDCWINGSATIHNAVFEANPGKAKSAPFKAGDFGIPEVLLTNKSYRIVNCTNKDLAKAMDEGLRASVASGELAKAYEALKVPANQSPDLIAPQQGC